MIDVRNLTKSYGPKRGIFDLSFFVQEGEVFGFLGPNGAGKTTTIRQLLGFIHPDNGSAYIHGLRVFEDAHIIQKDVGYIAGEIAFFDHMTGDEFLRFQAEMRGMNDFSRYNNLIELLEFNPKTSIRKMSKGTKQKLAIVAAFMHDPSIYILDEPTSGLDPLMQSKFVQLVHKEKKRGKTILMSSHNFEEVERTCDRALIIKHGEKMVLEDVNALKQRQRKVFVVHFDTDEERRRFNTEGFTVENTRNNELEIAVSGDVNEFIKRLSKCTLKGIDIKKQSLEEVFMEYYKEDEHE